MERIKGSTSVSYRCTVFDIGAMIEILLEVIKIKYRIVTKMNFKLMGPSSLITIYPSNLKSVLRIILGFLQIYT